MSRIYIGFEFWDSNRNCTTGDPNPRTRRMSIAGDYRVFSTHANRLEWIYEAGRRDRIAVTRRELRKLRGGQNLADFNEQLESSISCKDLKNIGGSYAD